MARNRGVDRNREEGENVDEYIELVACVNSCFDDEVKY